MSRYEMPRVRDHLPKNWGTDLHGTDFHDTCLKQSTRCSNRLQRCSAGSLPAEIKLFQIQPDSATEVPIESVGIEKSLTVADGATPCRVRSKRIRTGGQPWLGLSICQMERFSEQPVFAATRPIRFR